MEFFIIYTAIVLLFISSRKRKHEARELQDQVKSLQEQLTAARVKLESFRRESQEQHSHSQRVAISKVVPPIPVETKPPEIVFVPEQSHPTTIIVDMKEEETEEPRPVIDWNAVPAAMPPIRTREEADHEERIPEPPQPSIFDKIDWEMFMGAKLFAWIGGLLLFIGVSFFVKYSLDHDLIPAELRAAICYGIGVGMIGGGLWLSREKYLITVHTLCGTGILVLYGITFACRAYYHFEIFTPLLTMACMVLITVAAFMISIRLNAKTVAVMGILGGFLTPVLISTGENNPIGLFSYIAILDIGLLAVALVQGWGFIAILGVIGTFLLEVAWADRYFSQSGLNTTLWISLGYNFLFGVAAVIANRIGRLNERICWATGLTAILNYYFILFYYSHFQNHSAILFSLAFSASILLLGLSRVQEGMVRWFLIGGGFTFTVLLKWTVQKCENFNDIDPWSLYQILGLHFIFAIFHTVLPLYFQTFRDHNRQGKWIVGFSIAALWLCLWIPLQTTTIPWVVWGVILLLNLVIAGCALVAGSVLSIFVAGISTLLGSGICLWIKPQALLSDQLLPLLALVTGMCVLFFAAGLTLSTQFRKRGDAKEADLLPVFSILSAAWPFLLLASLAGGITLPNPSTIFGVAFLMALLLLGLSRYYYSGWLPGVALAGITLMQMAWYFRSFTVETIVIPLLWTVGFHFLLTLFPFCFKRSFLKEAGAWIASAVAGPIAFLFIYGMTESLIPDSMGGVLPSLFAVTSMTWLVLVMKGTSKEGSIRLTTLAWYGGIVLLFVTLIFPMQFDQHWLTVGWALEGVSLFWLFRQVRHPGLPGTGFSLLVTCFILVLWNSIETGCYVRTGTVFMNAYVFDYLIVLGAILGARQLVLKEMEYVFGLQIKMVLVGMAGVLLFIFMNLGINDIYESPGKSLAFGHELSMGGRLSGNLAQDMTYTISWTLFALGLLFFGLLKKIPYARYTGLGLVAVSLLKLFFHDLVRLDQLYRIGAFIAVALIMMVASFFYQKFVSSLVKQTE